MFNEKDKINEAFEIYMESYLSKETRAKIAETYGESIAAEVESIYKDALNCPVDWRTAKMDAALSALHRFLDSKYPRLTEKARTKINYAFIMAWK